MGSEMCIRDRWFSDFKSQFYRQPDKTLKRFQSLCAAGDKYGREVLRHLRSDALTSDFDLTECRLGLALLERDMGQAYLDLDRPCCFIHGMQDSVVSAQSVLELTQQTAAKLVLLDDTGHVPQLSHPELLATHINAFLHSPY